MFKAKTNFSANEMKRTSVRGYSGMYDNGIDEDLPINSAKLIQNFDLTDSGSLIARPRTQSTPYVFGADSNSDKHIVAFAKAFGNIVAFKGDGMYDVNATSGGTFTKQATVTDTGSNPTGYYDLKSFYSSHSVMTAIVSGTINANSSERYVTTATALTVNALVGKYLTIGPEVRIITGNTANTIYVYGTFDNAHASGSAFYVRDKEETILFFGTNVDTKCYRYNGTSYIPVPFVTGTHIDDAEIFAERVFYKKRGYNDTIFFTEQGILNYTPNNNTIKVRGNINRIKAFTDRLVIYTDQDVINLYGDSPDNFYLEYLKTTKLLKENGSIGRGNNIMFYLSSDGIEIQNQVDQKGVQETTGISYVVRDVINAYNLDNNAFLGEVWDNKYFLVLGTKTLVYDIDKSMKLGKPIFTAYEFTDYTGSPLTTREYVPTAVKRIGNDLYMAINGQLAKMVAYGTEIRPFANIGPTASSFIVESNKINLGDNLRNKLWRRLEINFGEDYDANVTHSVYLTFDNGTEEFVKSSTQNRFYVFFTKTAKKMKYRIISTPSAGENPTKPLELLQIDIGFSPEYKF